MSLWTTTLLAAGQVMAVMPPETAAEAKLLDAVAQVESGNDPQAVGDHGKAYGAWQMHEGAWADAQGYIEASGGRPAPWSCRIYRVCQRTTALASLRQCRDRLLMAGVDAPTVRQVYLAFAMGWSGFRACGFDPARAPERKRLDADRVLTLYLRR